MREVELLAPGGDVDSVKAAILAGASAVFLGVSEFNARKRAKNITLKELEELLSLAHERGVKLYITLNTLLTEEELPRAVKLIEELGALGVDAIIVQDYGLLGLMAPYADKMELHASTQMTTHLSAQLPLLKKLGVKQVNFSRELSLPEITALNKLTHALDMKSEVFVHGAFCVSYSGQCFFSTSLYGLSGNKGTCVQPCRREFSGDKVSSCSPFNLKDNAAYGILDELLDTGADSLKIEGRVKSADYVHTVVSTYKEQLNRITSGEGAESSSKALNSVFNREFTDGYLQGDVSKSMFTKHSKDQSLQKIGTVVTYSADKRELKLKSYELRKGAELHIKDKHNQFVCKGRVKRVLSDNSYHFVIEDKMQGRIYKGYTVYEKPMELIDQNLSDKIEAMAVSGTSINIRVTAKLGEPLCVEASCQGQRVTVTSQSPLQEASARPLSMETIQEKLGKLGGTSFTLGNVTVESFDDNLFLPIKELNVVKREMVERLEQPKGSQEILSITFEKVTPKRAFKNGLALLINKSEDLSLKDDVDAILYEMPLEITTEEHTLFEHEPSLIPWFQAILTEEQFHTITSFINACSIKKIIAENSGLALWATENGIEVITGPHLNLTNSQAVHTMATTVGAEGVFLSKELNTEQLSAIRIPEGVDLWFPLVEHELLMNTKQCLVRNTLGCSKESVDEACLMNCNRSTFVKEKQGREISVMKRTGFNNQIFRSKMKFHKEEAMALARSVDYWLIDVRDIQSRTTFEVTPMELISQARIFIQKPNYAFIQCFDAIDSKPMPGLA